MDYKGFTGAFEIVFQEDNMIINPKKQHKYTLIWLHGLNQTPAKFLKLFLEFPLIDILDEFRIVIPCAPYRKNSINDGQLMRSWFDVKDRSQKTFEQPISDSFGVEDILESTKIIEKIIRIELQSIDEKHLFIGGFSQGCAMTLHLAYTLRLNFAGVIPVAGYLFDITPFSKDVTFPIKIFHGTADRTRPWNFIKSSYERQGAQVTMIENMDHEYQNPELRKQIKDFILSIINK